jgi:hypothetical protein
MSIIRNSWRLAAAGAAIALLGACADNATTAPTGGTPAFTILPVGPTPTPTTKRLAEFEYIEVCKTGSVADFHAEHNDGQAGLQTVDFTLADDGCREVAVLSAGDGNFTVSETAAPVGYQLDSIRVTQKTRPAGTLVVNVYTGTSTVLLSPADNTTGGWLVEYFNSLVPTGCTLTIGYWKNWDGGGPQPDQVTQYLPVTLGAGGGKSVTVSNTTTSNAILSFNYAGGHPSNGITKLYAQLLGAKLNIASGANGSAVASTIAAADAFLVLYNQADWSSLSKSQKQTVNGWMSALDQYNNGLTGPGHCF